MTTNLEIILAPISQKQNYTKLRDERAIGADHHLHEFGSVEYYIQSLVSDPDHTYLSISTPILSQAFLVSTRLSRYTIQKVKAISTEVVEIVEPPKEGYQLTIRLNFARMPHGQESVKMITDIAAVQGVILSSQLEEMLMNVNSQDVAQGMYKPIKLVYHPREPFYVIKQPQKITAVFPMRFKEKTDVIIATTFFQELMDVANTKACAKAPHCIWSPIPPPELRGEAIEDLSTNGGFVSFDISSRHIEGKRLDKTVWNLLNFYAFVKNHVKSTRGFIQRRMRTCLKSLVEVLQKTGPQDEQQIKERPPLPSAKTMQDGILALEETFMIGRQKADFVAKKLEEGDSIARRRKTPDGLEENLIILIASRLSVFVRLV
ncbi:hypothetical protein KY289_037240 [Solanum tuberosum]|nr:hypothetical protein KY289_037240 [Solanum tuberosum]